MGVLKPKVENVAVDSQATPLAEDVLGMLQKQITGGTFGTGFGPLQQRAGTAMEQFITNRENPMNFLEMMSPLVDQFNMQADKSASKTREGFGATGNRFSRSLATAEGQVRGESNTNLQAMLSQLFEQSQGQLLSAITGLQNFGAQNTAPAFNLAGQGINPDNTVVTENPFMQILKLAAPIIGTAFGKPPV